MSASYLVNEIFYSVQGEGVLAGTPMVFVRFAKCNLECKLEAGARSPGGFDCDTEFESGRRVSLDEIELWIHSETDDATLAWLLLTGGEPALQVDVEFLTYFRAIGWKIAIETNGSILLPHVECDFERECSVDEMLRAVFPLFDHITVSPKVAEHAIRQRWAHEVRYVRASGQAVPQTSVRAKHKLVSPASLGDRLDQRAVAWCTDLVKQHPEWRLSVQQHKSWGVR